MYSDRLTDGQFKDDLNTDDQNIDDRRIDGHFKDDRRIKVTLKMIKKIYR